MKNPFKRNTEVCKEPNIGANIVGHKPSDMMLSDFDKLGQDGRLVLTYQPHPGEFDYRYWISYMPRYTYGNYSYGKDGQAAVRNVGMAGLTHYHDSRIDIEDDNSITLSFKSCPSLYQLQEIMAEIDYRIGDILKDYERFHAFARLKKGGD